MKAALAILGTILIVLVAYRGQPSGTGYTIASSPHPTPTQDDALRYVSIISVSASDFSAGPHANSFTTQTPDRSDILNLSPSEIEWLPYPIYTINEPDSLAQVYDELAAAALSGDTNAAHSLYRNLNNCLSYGYESSSDLKAAVLELMNTHSYTTADGKRVNVSPTISSDLDEAVNLEDEVEWLVTNFDRCNGISVEQASGAIEWLKLAANLGSLPALKELTARLPASDEKVAYLEKQWQAGDPFALYELSRIYERDSGGHEPDDIHAYSGYLLFTEIMKLNENNAGPYSSWRDFAEERLANLEAKLLPAQRREAIEQADDMFSRQSQCCRVPKSML